MLLACGAIVCSACGPSEPAQGPDDSATPVIEVAKPTPSPETVILAPPPKDSAATQDPSACFRQLIEGPSLGDGNPPPDEELYHQGLIHEHEGRRAEARKAYLELVENHKRSPFVPLAYLRFGEMFAEEGQKDAAKWPIAQNFYKEVMKYMPPESQVLGYAAYRSGFVHQNLQEHAKAIDTFKRAIDYHHQFPSAPCGEHVARLSRRALIASYAQVGKPMRAFALFHPLSGDHGSETANTAAMMLDLAEAYQTAGRQRDTLAVVTDVLKRTQSPDVCSRVLALLDQLNPASSAEQRQLQRIESNCL